MLDGQPCVCRPICLYVCPTACMYLCVSLTMHTCRQQNRVRDLRKCKCNIRVLSPPAEPYLSPQSQTLNARCVKEALSLNPKPCSLHPRPSSCGLRRHRAFSAPRCPILKLWKPPNTHAMPSSSKGRTSRIFFTRLFQCCTKQQQSNMGTWICWLQG